MRAEYFFLLSGEYETLPKAELEAVLHLLDPEHRLRSLGERVVSAETIERAAAEAVARTAYTKLSALLLAETSTREDEILGSVEPERFREVIPRGSKIAVRGFLIGGARLRKTWLEGMLGGRILEAVPGLKVDLRSPDYTIAFVSWPERTAIGVLRAVKPRRFFYDRVAGRRPFSLPSAMQPDFSRCMVNLARVKLGGRILDPFAGTGGIMVEALLLGYQVYGVELKRWIAEGALRNLRRYAPGVEHMVVGDARRLMFRAGFDGVVTDPPYGRSTTVPERSVQELLRSFFHGCGELLREGARICMAVPEGVWVEDLAGEAGFRLMEAHRARVHGSLVRRVVVLE